MKRSRKKRSKSRLCVVEVEVNPAEPSGRLCWPDPAPACSPHIETRFKFRLSDPRNWKWVGTSPVVSKGPRSQFPDPSFISAGRAVLRDVNSDDGMYKYTVTVIHKTTHHQVEIDPFIQNQ